MQATGRRDDHERQKNRLKDGNATEHGHSHGGTTCVFDMRGPGARSAHDQGMDNTTREAEAVFPTSRSASLYMSSRDRFHCYLVVRPQAHEHRPPMGRAARPDRPGKR